MKKLMIGMGTALCGLTVAAVCMAQKDAPQKTGKPSAAASQPPQPAIDDEATKDEKAIHELIDQVEKFYNAADAKGIASLFTEEGELVSEDGEITHGREAIEALFAELFEATPGAKMTIEVASIRSISPNLVIEDGITTVTTTPDAPPNRSQYTVVHVKQNNTWRMASARDIVSVDPSNNERLQQLSWLIGDWVDESSESVVKSSYKWSKDGNFILNEFSAQFAGMPAMSGTQRIGWDPLANQIRSWLFDSTGGFGEGLWTRDGDRWVIKHRVVTSNGQVGSSTNVLTAIDTDRWGWESYDRMAGGQLTPEIERVIVVRKPPQPDTTIGADKK